MPGPFRFTVFGLGNSEYGVEKFNRAALDIDAWLRELGATRVASPSVGDESVADSKAGGQEQDYVAWKRQFWTAARPAAGATGDVEVFVGAAESLDSDEEHVEDEGEDGGEEDGVVDLEDIGDAMAKAKDVAARNGSVAPRGMITPQLRTALTKQGYKLIGSHSGVKLCRWTKSMLRGRGGCYKHTFYGIESHRCMETTPSLACANKCVFCWRHHTNPVGTEWRWKMDEPDVVIDGAMQNHYNMIKTFKGVPGVIPERYAEANHIKHCALSLVGEPIMCVERLAERRRSQN